MGIIRICTAPISEATASDCLAHRCDEHATAGLVNNEDPKPECGVCVANAAVAAVMNEIVVPILMAYENAAGALVLSGATKDPKVAVLAKILDAAVEMKNDGEFKPQFPVDDPTPPGKVN